MFKSIEKIYGSWFGGAEQGRHEVTDETMKSKETVDAILKIGLFWKKNREQRWGFTCDAELQAIKDEFPTETTTPDWVDHKDHMRFLWGYTIGRRLAVLFKQGKVSEDELFDEE